MTPTNKLMKNVLPMIKKTTKNMNHHSLLKGYGYESMPTESIEENITIYHCSVVEAI